MARVALPIALVACAAPPVTLPARPFRDTLAVELRVAGQVHDGVIDSGAPWLALDPGAFGAVAGAAMVGPVQVRGRIQRLPICGAACRALPAAAIPLVALAPRVTLDYRARQVRLGGPDPRGDVVPARLLAGSRFVVDATIEGERVHALVDTGSSAVIVRRRRMAALLGDGRPSLATRTTSGLGPSTGTIARARSVELGAARSLDVPVEATATMDAFMDGVSRETGVQIDALIGGSFLRDYAVTFEASRLVVVPAPGDPLDDAYQRAPSALEPMPDGRYR
ncbi:MAG TPA: retropepsin-like aspartic protease, partial [Kofleriaceae bacterium]|nr:retropepsin-like aspartic protease [Kofleriaceae bacterium]